MELFDHLPTVWDETRVIHGKTGEYATFARRYGRSYGRQGRALRPQVSSLN